jgi:hypothetical protein
VRHWIDTHRAGARLGFKRLDFRELVWRILVKNSENTSAGFWPELPCSLQFLI